MHARSNWFCKWRVCVSQITGWLKFASHVDYIQHLWLVKCVFVQILLRTLSNSCLSPILNQPSTTYKPMSKGNLVFFEFSIEFIETNFKNSNNKNNVQVNANPACTHIRKPSLRKRVEGFFFFSSSFYQLL